VDGEAVKKFGSLPLKAREPVMSERAFIVQYLGTQEKSLPARIVRNGCRVAQHDPIGDFMGVSGSYLLYHFCDTLSGSSGAPIIAESDGAILGMNIGGSPEINFGIRFTRVLQRIEILRSLAAQ
jgi:hypothetical protein